VLVQRAEAATEIGAANWQSLGKVIERATPPLELGLAEETEHERGESPGSSEHLTVSVSR
jgi:hypothetical protein